MRGFVDRAGRIEYNEGALDETGLPISEQYCYLITRGRNTGREHSIEIWFAAQPGDDTIYMLAGGGLRADWVKNMGVNPGVQVRIKERVYAGTGRVITDPQEELLARRLVVKKYYGRDRLHTSGWEAEALPVAIDLSSS